MKKMRNLCKRGLSLLIVLVMCLSMLQIAAFAEGSALDEALESATGTTEDSAENKADAIEKKQQEDIGGIVDKAVEDFKKAVQDYVTDASGENPPEDLKEPEFKDAAEDAIQDSIYKDVDSADKELREELEQDQDLASAVEQVKKDVNDTLNQDFEGKDGVDALNQAAQDKAGELEQNMKDNDLLNEDGSVNQKYRDSEIDGIIDEAGREIDEAAAKAAEEAGEEGRDLVEQANSSVDAALNQANATKGAAAGIVEAAEQAVKDAQDRDLTQEERQAAADQIEAQVEALEESVNATNSAVAKAEEDYAAAAKMVEDLVAQLEAELNAIMDRVEEDLEGITLPDLQEQLDAANQALELAAAKLEAARDAQKTAEDMVKRAQQALEKAAGDLGLDVEVEIKVGYDSKSVNKDELDKLVQQAKDANAIEDARKELEAEQGIKDPEGVRKAVDAEKDLEDALDEAKDVIGSIKRIPEPYDGNGKALTENQQAYSDASHKLTSILIDLKGNYPDSLTTAYISRCLENIEGFVNRSYAHENDTNGNGEKLEKLWNKLYDQLTALQLAYSTRDSARGDLSPEDQALADLLSGSYNEENDPTGEQEKKRQELEDALNDYFERKKEHNNAEPIDWNDEELWKKLLQKGEGLSTSVNPDGNDENGLFESAKKYLQELADDLWGQYLLDLDDANERVGAAQTEFNEAQNKVNELQKKLKELETQLANKKAAKMEELQRQLDEAMAELALKKDELDEAKAAQAEAQGKLDKANEILEGLKVWTPDPVDDNDDEDDGPTRTSGSSTSGNVPGGNLTTVAPGGISPEANAQTGNVSGTDVTAGNASGTDVTAGNVSGTDVTAGNASETGVPTGNAPEAGVPTGNTPNAAAPIVNIPNAGVPLVNTPAVNASETGTAGEAENLVDIAEGDVPLAGISNEEAPTNNQFMWWWLLLLLIIVCVTTRQILKNKKREDQN